MQLFRQDYGEELLAEAPVNVEWGGLLSLTLRVRGSHILVLQDGAPVMAFTDPMGAAVWPGGHRCDLRRHGL